MKIDKRIVKALDYDLREIEINEIAYKNLDEETKAMLRMRNIKIRINNKIKEFKVIF